METEYTIITKFRNKEQFDILFAGLQKKKKTCYNFFDIPADPNNPNATPEEQMKTFEHVENFFEDEYFKKMFEEDLRWLQNAEKIITLLPAWMSVHIEAWIAYGLWKHLILIGKPEKPESLYLIFHEHYNTIEDFLATL